MPNKICLRSFLLFLLLTLGLFAIDGKVKVFIPSQTSIYTSQKITVSVELLSSAFSITDTKITFPASPKYIIQAPQSASYLGQEEVDGEDWQMVHYDYKVYALQAGKIEIPSVLVSFTASMGYGQPKKEFELQSDALSFEVNAPKGVKEDQFVLVTDTFMLHSELKPQKKKLIVGDAVELSVTQKAKGIPDILLTPIDYKSSAYLRVYNKEPVLKSGLKGVYDVSRTDRFTFVAGVEGNVTLPAQERMWYNSMTQKIHIEKSPEMIFEILPDPQIAIDAQKAKQKQMILYVVLALFIILIFYWLFASKIHTYSKERKRQYVQSEAGKFDALFATIESNDISLTYKALYTWLFTINPELARGSFSMISDVQPSLKVSLDALEEKIVNPKKKFDTAVFTEELYKLRELLLRKQQRREGELPQTINPNIF